MTWREDRPNAENRPVGGAVWETAKQKNKDLYVTTARTLPADRETTPREFGAGTFCLAVLLACNQVTVSIHS